MLRGIVHWYLHSLSTGGYPLIVLLMTMESSVLPLPSEFVIPPAAVLAHQQGVFSLPGIILAGALGSWAGATLMYWASRLAGRPLVLKYGRYVFIPPAKVEAAELWAKRFGPLGVFCSRLLPVVRHLIGLPAGIVRMGYWRYSLYTVLGSGLWCAVLCWVGVMAGQDQELMHGELRRITLWLGGTVFVLGTLYYFFVYRLMKPQPAKGVGQ